MTVKQFKHQGCYIIDGVICYGTIYENADVLLYENGFEKRNVSSAHDNWNDFVRHIDEENQLQESNRTLLICKVQ